MFENILEIIDSKLFFQLLAIAFIIYNIILIRKNITFEKKLRSVLISLFALAIVAESVPEEEYDSKEDAKFSQGIATGYKKGANIISKYILHEKLFNDNK